MREPQTRKKIFFGVVGEVLLFCPFSTKAVEELAKSVEATELEKTPLLSKAGTKLKVGALAVTGLKVVVDPSAPPMRKAIAGAKLVCCGGYAGANLVSSVGAFSPQVKIALSACCGAAWLMLSGLEYIDSKS